MVAKSEKKHQCAKIGFADLTGMVSVSIFGWQGTAMVWPFTCSHWEVQIVHPFRKKYLRKRKSPLRNWSERAVSVCINTLFPRGNFYLLEDGSFTRHPCAQFEHMELWAHSLMIYYFQREIFTLWEATSSDYFPRGQIDHLELPIVIGSNWPNNTGHMLQSGKWANCPLTKKPSKQ